MFRHHAYVGCRTSRERNARGLGISVFGIDEAGDWHLLNIRETAANPSFLAASADGRHLYAVHGDGTEMSAFGIGVDGLLTELDRATTAGLNPVDVVLDPSQRFLVVTNHLTGSVVVRRRRTDGGFGEITAYVQLRAALGPHRLEQASVKPHQARFDPTGRRLVVPNKGSDTASLLDFDPADGSLAERVGCTAILREGCGPRNVAFHPVLSVLYVVGELDSTVYALRMDASGQLEPFQVLSCLPEDAFGLSRAAGIHCALDGTALHVSNRGHDSICTFSLEPGSGRLSAPRWTSSLGRTPRFIGAGTEAHPLLVANEDSDIVVGITHGGTPHRLAGTASPTCIVLRPGPATASSIA
ncbi:lactonase family protein [Antarcticirhabdus aurantiaca]|uniref:Beta-propeller fold lactonase family protein n=1 Tax=Antarcticirhabdus aurantiaca TaxID=2606717 RepID=A0ACD4NW39_9HYPH|nr:beta-propeller fold lactonase family protein [Antarcticirhabdus aurantiaca]WAJ31008.1 beta-propeller fold lactonase family protein [Jeongeuplla avenae]